MDIPGTLARLVERQDLDREESHALFLAIMSGDVSPAQMGALLTALRMKGETTAEVAGAASAMRALSARVEVDAPNLVDTCGTGGSGAKLFNVSTASAFAAAAAGAHVAKHGNRKASSQSGSADVLEAAGANIQLTPEQIAHCVREVGVGFMFAQAHHPAMRHVGPVRADLKLRTLFNVLGPMTNPAGARRQVVGVFNAAWQQTMAEVLQMLGTEHALVVHSGGLDEIGLAGPTRVVEVRGDAIDTYEISPEDFGIASGPTDALTADSVDTSLALVRQSLREPDSRAADLVALNAGAAIYASGVATTFANGVLMAQDAIASGLAQEKLTEFVRITSLMAEE